MHRASAASGLVVLAFPCDQFGGQELGTEAQISAFTEQLGVPRGGADAGFAMMQKVDVNGKGTHGVFRFLKQATPDSSDIKWNFGTYWLVDKAGKVQRLNGLKSSPASFGKRIAELLAT